MAWGSTRSRASATAVGAVLLAVVAVLLLATWASSVGPREMFRGELDPTTADEEVVTSPTTSTPPAGEGEPEEVEAAEPPPGWARVLAAAIQVAAVLVALLLLARLVLALRRVRLPRRRLDVARSDIDFEVVDAEQLYAVADAVAGDADEHEALLAAGTPRNGIVACWHRFEEQAGSAGVGRAPWETSSEFTLRLLGAVSTDDRAVARLAALYREARFSDHVVGEGERAAAAEALSQVRTGIRVTDRRSS